MAKIAERLAYLEAVVGADITQFRKGMRDIRNESGILSETLQGLAGIGRSLTYTLTTPLVALGSYTVQAASEFDAAMRNINSIVGLTEQELTALSDEVLQFGKNARTGATGAAEALYEVFSAGFGLNDTAAAMELMEESVRVSEAGLADLTRTTNAMTATLMAYGVENITAAHAGDVWTRMVQVGVGSLEDFLANSNKVLPIASALGISFDEVGASAAYLSQQGGGAKKAMTAIAMALSNLIKPNLTLAAAYEELGVQTGQELIAKFGGLQNAILAIRKVTESDVDFAKMFSKTGMEAVLAFTNNVDQAQATFNEFYAAVDGATDRAWAEQMKSFAATFDLFKSSVQAAAIAIGKQLLPIIQPILEGLTGFFNKVSSASPETLQFAVRIGILAAALPPLLWAFGALTSALSPLGLLLKGGILLMGAFATNFGGLKDSILGGAKDILAGLKPLSDAVGIFFDEVFPTDKIAESGQKATDEMNRWLTSFGLMKPEPTDIDFTETITVTEPKSLWQIYEEGGWADKFSWQEFMKEAKAGGWDGGAVDPGEYITIRTGELDANTVTALRGFIKRIPEQAQTLMNTILGRGQPIEVPLQDRVRMGIEKALPGIMLEMGKILDGIRGWADTNIGYGIGEVAKLFDGSQYAEGDTPVFNAVKLLLEGDIFGAIDVVIPGAGTKIKELIGSDWGAKIQEAFPTISANLTTFFANFGSWLENEGLPTISRSFGYILGKVAVEVGRGIGNLWNAITQGNAIGEGANTLGRSVVTPFQEGFQEAMMSENVGNVTDQFFTGLEGALLAAAAAWVIAPAVTGEIIGIVTTGLMLAAKGAWRFAGVAMTIIDSLFTAISVSGSLFGGIAASIKGLGATIVGKVSAAVAGSAVLSSLWTGAVMAVGTGLSAAFGLVTAAASWIVGIAGSIAGAITTALGATVFGLPVLAIALAAGGSVLIGKTIYDAIAKELAKPIQAENAERINYEVETATGVVAISELTMELGIAGAAIIPDDKFQDWMKEQPYAYIIESEWEKIKPTLTPATINVPVEAVPELPKLNVSGEDMMAGVSGTMDAATVASLIPVSAILPSEEVIKEEATTVASTAMTAIAEQAALAFTGAADPAVTAKSVVQPFADEFERVFGASGEATTSFTGFVADYGSGTAKLLANTLLKIPLAGLTWVATFGTIGTATLAVTGFQSTVDTKFTEIETSFNDLKAKVDTAMPAIRLKLETEVSGMTKALDTLKQGVEGVGTALDALSKKPPVNVQVNMTGTGAGLVPNGSHAMGLTKVPYDGYLAELHKDERVLTAQEAARYEDAMSGKVATGAQGGGSTKNYNSSNVFNIYGVNDVDAFIREMKRRGYSIPK